MINKRSLPGMSESAKKRAARRWLWPDDNRRDALKIVREMVAESPLTRHEYQLARKPYRIGQRLRPCPGCDKCTDSPHSLVLGWTRRIGGHAKLTRIFSRWYKRAEYLLMIYRPGPTWNPAAGGGLTKAEAWKNMADCLREHDQLKVLCDGSGVLPANGKVRMPDKSKEAGKQQRLFAPKAAQATQLQLGG